MPFVYVTAINKTFVLFGSQLTSRIKTSHDFQNLLYLLGFVSFDMKTKESFII